MTNDSTRAELDHLRRSLREWALADVEKAAAAGVKVGAFILGANLVDVLARLAYSKPSENARAAWDEFIPKYLSRYAGHANELYRGFRSAISHNYSLGDIRLTDGPANSLRHWTIEDGERVLHLESFIADLDAAWEQFYSDVERDKDVRKRVLDRARERPPLGILGGEYVESSASVAHGVSLMIGGFSPTHFGAPPSSDAAWPTTPTPLVPPPGVDSEKRAIPKKRKRKGKR